MLRGIVGAVAGVVVRAAVASGTGHRDLAVAAGWLTAITIWFWAWGPAGSGRG